MDPATRPDCFYFTALMVRVLILCGEWPTKQRVCQVIHIQVGNIQIPPQGRNSLFLMQHYGACVVFQWRVPKKSLGVLWGPWWDRTAVWPCFLQLCSCVLRWKRGRWHQKSIAPPPQDLLLTSHSPQLVSNSFLQTPHSQSSWMQSTKEQLRQGLGCHSCSGREGINIHDLQ